MHRRSTGSSAPSPPSSSHAPPSSLLHSRSDGRRLPRQIHLHRRQIRSGQPPPVLVSPDRSSPPTIAAHSSRANSAVRSPLPNPSPTAQHEPSDPAAAPSMPQAATGAHANTKIRQRDPDARRTRSQTHLPVIAFQQQPLTIGSGHSIFPIFIQAVRSIHPRDSNHRSALAQHHPSRWTTPPPSRASALSAQQQRTPSAPSPTITDSSSSPSSSTSLPIRPSLSQILDLARASSNAPSAPSARRLHHHDPTDACPHHTTSLPKQQQANDRCCPFANVASSPATVTCNTRSSDGQRSQISRPIFPNSSIIRPHPEPWPTVHNASFHSCRPSARNQQKTDSNLSTMGF